MRTDCDCEATSPIETRSGIVCRGCGIVIDCVYDTSEQISFEEVADRGQPMKDDDLRSYELVRLILNNLKLDVTVSKKKQLIAAVTRFKMQLTEIDEKQFKHPSPYYYAVANVFAVEFELDHKYILEMMTGKITRTVMKKLNKSIEFARVYLNKSDEHQPGLEELSTSYLNNKDVNKYAKRYVKYYKDNHIPKIAQLHILQKRNGKSIKQIFRDTNYPPSRYFDTKRIIRNKNNEIYKYSAPGPDTVISDAIARRILELSNNGFTTRNIRDIIAWESYFEPDEEYLDLHHTTIYKFLKKHQD